MTTTVKTRSRSALIPKPARQPMPVGRARTMELILSVIERKLWPAGVYFELSPPCVVGTGGAWVSPGSRDASVAMSLRLQFGVRVAQRRQIGRAWVRIQVRQQAIVQRRVLPLADLAQRPPLPAILVDIAKDNRLRRTSSLASGQDFLVSDG